MQKKFQKNKNKKYLHIQNEPILTNTVNVRHLTRNTRQEKGRGHQGPEGRKMGPSVLLVLIAGVMGSKIYYSSSYKAKSIL